MIKALTDEQIEEVRRRYAAGESKAALSREFCVSDVTIAILNVLCQNRITLIRFVLGETNPNARTAS